MTARNFITGTNDPTEVTFTRIRGNPNHLEIRWTQRTEDGTTRHMRHVVLSITQEITPRPSEAP